jgi:hypothetical protein
MNYGREGEHYTLDGNLLIRTPETAEKLKANAFEFQKETGIWTYTFLFYPYYRVQQDDTPDVARSRTIADKWGIDCTEYNYNVKPDPTSAEGIISTQVNDIVAKEFPKIFMAESGQAALSALEAMIAKLDKVNLPELEAYWTKQYKNNRTLFGLD